MKKHYPLMLMLMTLLVNCGVHKSNSSVNMALPPVVIYKTTADYSNHVPLVMNASRTKIVSYPAPTDVYNGGGLALPTQLENGYWLDNRGIGKYVVFTDYTYEEYSQLEQLPILSVLESRIVDKYPLLEMYECRSFGADTPSLRQLNKLVRGGFKDCQVIVEPKL